MVSTKIVPTYEVTQKRNAPVKSFALMPAKSKTYQLEEWTEKLLEEARDDLAAVDAAVQTPEDTPKIEATPTFDQSTQTEIDIQEANRQV